MSLIKGLSFSVLFFSLVGCQTVKFDDMFAGTDKAQPVENTQAQETEAVELPLLEQSPQLLSTLALQTQQSFSLADEKQAQAVLENNFTHQLSQWKIASGELVILPVKTFDRDGQGTFCRHYQAKLITTIKEVSVKSLACRQADGLWIRQE